MTVRCAHSRGGGSSFFTPSPVAEGMDRNVKQVWVLIMFKIIESVFLTCLLSPTVVRAAGPTLTRPQIQAAIQEGGSYKSIDQFLEKGLKGKRVKLAGAMAKTASASTPRSSMTGMLWPPRLLLLANRCVNSKWTRFNRTGFSMFLWRSGVAELLALVGSTGVTKAKGRTLC